MHDVPGGHGATSRPSTVRTTSWPVGSIGATASPVQRLAPSGRSTRTSLADRDARGGVGLRRGSHAVPEARRAPRPPRRRRPPGAALRTSTEHVESGRRDPPSLDRQGGRGRPPGARRAASPTLMPDTHDGRGAGGRCRSRSTRIPASLRSPRPEPGAGVLSTSLGHFTPARETGVALSALSTWRSRRAAAATARRRVGVRGRTQHQRQDQRRAARGLSQVRSSRPRPARLVVGDDHQTVGGTVVGPLDGEGVGRGAVSSTTLRGSASGTSVAPRCPPAVRDLSSGAGSARSRSRRESRALH